LCYCIKEEDIKMVKDWNKEWRIPILNQDIPADREAEEGKENTPAEEIMVPKKPRIV
jgi:hypothetical protein